MAFIGFFGFAISRFSYAWLLGSVTANLVMLMAFTQPQTAFTIAVDRAADVVIGTLASLLVCGLMPAADDTGPVAAPGQLGPPPHESDPLAHDTPSPERILPAPVR